MQNFLKNAEIISWTGQSSCILYKGNGLKTQVVYYWSMNSIDSIIKIKFINDVDGIFFMNNALVSMANVPIIASTNLCNKVNCIDAVFMY